MIMSQKACHETGPERAVRDLARELRRPFRAFALADCTQGSGSRCRGLLHPGLGCAAPSALGTLVQQCAPSCRRGPEIFSGFAPEEAGPVIFGGFAPEEAGPVILGGIGPEEAGPEIFNGFGPLGGLRAPSRLGSQILPHLCRLGPEISDGSGPEGAGQHSPGWRSPRQRDPKPWVRGRVDPSPEGAKQKTPSGELRPPSAPYSAGFTTQRLRHSASFAGKRRPEFKNRCTRWNTGMEERR